MRTHIAPWCRPVICVADGCIPSLLLPADPVAERHWVQDRFADFPVGQLADSGVGLYVTHRGAVKVVNRFHLNGDRYPELDRVEVVLH